MLYIKFVKKKDRRKDIFQQDTNIKSILKVQSETTQTRLKFLGTAVCM